MTDRYNGIVVIFDEPIREDDLEIWVNAIRIMKKVIKVIPIADAEEIQKNGFHGLIMEQAKYELRAKIDKVLE
jgi:hypothetical protein